MEASKVISNGVKHIVTFGGGTGTFVVLSGLRALPDVSLTAIVSSADDGGSTGTLRDAYGFLPAGDARQALVALAEDGSTLRNLFAYRFDKGNVSGHNLGNLFITALTDMLGSDALAIEEASKILRISGRVLSASDSPAVLVATLADDSQIVGEAAIDERTQGRAPISSVSYKVPVPLSDSAREAVQESSVIVLGPGDLFTSTAAALLPEGTQEAIQASSATIIYIVNLFTKAGQTDDMAASDHVRMLTKYAGRAPDFIVLHNTPFSDEVLSHYAKEHECPVVDDLPQDTHIIRADIASMHTVPALPNDPVPRSLMRHDSAKLAEALAPLLS